jgi:hypothetical protein
MRVIAIDWSGKQDGGRSTIWIAEAEGPRIRTLESGRSRDEVVDWLIEQRANGGRGVVGLDFAFSLPAWYLDERGWADATAMWAAMADEAEALLADCEPPFWGRPGRKRPRDGRRALRRTEDDVGAVGGVRPKSVFQIGGAGAVGTGSLRGMVALHRLHAAGFAVWPFTAPAAWTLVEIYPRALTGPVTKSDPGARREHLARYPELAPEHRELASASEDAFDAAVSALVMSAHSDELAALAHDYPREGRIWAHA